MMSTFGERIKYDTCKKPCKNATLCAEMDIEFLTSKSKMSPIDTWSIFGPPAQTMRWCCSVHKTTPQIITLREYTDNPHFKGMAFTGIRGDESASRSEYDDVSDEVINLFRDDNGDNYIYISEDGKINPKYNDSVDAVLFVRHIEKGVMEIIAKAEGLEQVLYKTGNVNEESRRL